MRLGLAATPFLMLLFAVRSSPYNGVKQIVTGTVESISADSITLETARGIPRVLTILLSPSTKLLEDGASVSRKELLVGDRVVVTAKPNADKLEAGSVLISKKPAPGKTAIPMPRRPPRYDAGRRPEDASPWGSRREIPPHSLGDDRAS